MQENDVPGLDQPQPAQQPQIIHPEFDTQAKTSAMSVLGVETQAQQPDPIASMPVPPRRISIDIIAWVTIVVSILAIFATVFAASYVPVGQGLVTVLLAIGILTRKNVARIIMVVLSAICVVYLLSASAFLYIQMRYAESEKNLVIATFQDKIKSDPSRAKEYQDSLDKFETAISDIRNSPTGKITRAIPYVYTAQALYYILLIWFFCRKSIRAEFS